MSISKIGINIIVNVIYTINMKNIVIDLPSSIYSHQHGRSYTMLQFQMYYNQHKECTMQLN